MDKEFCFKFDLLEYVKGESENHSEADTDAKGCGEDAKLVKACTPLILITRSLIIFTFSALLLIAICCRYCVDWSSYFQSHCLLSNGTLLPLRSRSAARELGCVHLIPWTQNPSLQSSISPLSLVLVTGSSTNWITSSGHLRLWLFDCSLSLVELWETLRTVSCRGLFSVHRSGEFVQSGAQRWISSY